MFSLKQLSYALAVEKTLHFKQAADYCHVSQSALSTGLSDLEKQLGTQIFERNNKKVLITPLGREVLKRARQILLQAEDLQQFASQDNTPLQYPLNLGVIPTIAPYLLPPLLPLLNRQYPNAKLNLVEEQSEALLQQLRHGELDCVILALPYPHEGLLSLEFWQEDFYWVTRKGNAHSEQQEITSKELSQSKLMLLKDGHCLKDHVLQACKLPLNAASHSLAATSLHTLMQMVVGQLGSTLIPAMALPQLVAQNSQLSAVHLKEPGPHRHIAFLLRPNFSRMSSVEALMTLAKQALASSSG